MPSTFRSEFDRLSKHCSIFNETQHVSVKVHFSLLSTWTETFPGNCSGVQKHDIALFSLHQMGSCRMGKSVEDSVADGEGECWECFRSVHCRRKRLPHSIRYCQQLFRGKMAHDERPLSVFSLSLRWNLPRFCQDPSDLLGFE